jgi:hypothetical protein
MIKSIAAVAGICLFTMGQSCVSMPQVQAGLKSSCETGTRFYGYFQAAATTGAVKQSLVDKVGDAWEILTPICEDPASATDADIVMAAAQVLILTKAWRDAA